MKKEIKKATARKGPQAASRNGSKSDGVQNLTSEEAGTIDKVRELLFGQSVRELDSQVEVVQGKMMKALNEARQDSLQRFDQLEAYIKAENRALSDAIKQEARTRASEVAKAEQGIAKLNEDLLAQGESNKQSASDLRDQILQQGKELASSISTTASNLKTELEQESARLNNDLASRGMLAKMFSELAVQLSDSE